jgi:integrase
MPRRGHNEGNIRKRPDGRWEARVSLPDSRRKSIYGKTRADVARKMAVVMTEVEKGMPVADDRVRMASFLDQWLENVGPTIRPRTLQSYESHVRVHIGPALGSVPLTKLQPRQVQAFINGLLDDGLSPSTVQRVRATLRCALNQARRWGMVQRNVATLIDMPKVERPRFEPMTLEQARRMMDAAASYRIAPILNVALATGLRQGEILGLRWQDIDLEAGTLTVRYALQRIDGEFILVKPKTELSQRRLPLTGRVVALLRDHKQAQEAGEPIAGWVGELVFRTINDRPYNGTDVTLMYQDILKKAGLPKHRFHDLRHACATFLLAEGVELQVVKETLGHSQISLTADTYAHVMPSLKKDAADKLGEALWGQDWGQNGNSST